jgi:HPt (histidine-containing phosphotransfer) domain-containing protein
MDGSKTMWYLPETLREIEEDSDDSLVLELIASFEIDTARRFERLHESFLQRDAARVKAEAHSMRGSSRQMGAEALADLCQALEGGAPQMNWPELECQAKQAEACFAEVRSAMSEYVQRATRIVDA